MAEKEIESQKSGSQKVKRTRKGTPKARWGCLTCKIRHIRCDEQKPACLRCTSTGRTCDFLQPTITRTHPAKLVSKQPQKPHRMKSILPTTPESITSTGSQDVILLPKLSPPPSIFHLDQSEVIHFDYFRSVCIDGLSGYFENSLWDNVILQFVCSEPSLKAAAIAVGAGYRYDAERYSTDKGERVLKQYSTSKYHEAMRLLNQRLDGSSTSYEVALMASILFMILETIENNDVGALMHFEAAFSVLRSLQQKQQHQFEERNGEQSSNLELSLRLPTPPLRPKFSSSTLDTLTAAFTRIEIQASTFAVPYVPKPHDAPVLPSYFTNLSEARAALDGIIASMYHVLSLGLDMQDTPLADRAAISVTIAASHMQDLFTTWNSLFETLLVNQPTIPTNSIAVLKIQLICAQVHLQNYLAPVQLAYDNFHAAFTEAVELGELVLQPNPSPVGLNAHLSFDVGIIQPLYFVALKCRDGLLRRRAQRILDRAEREGVWDGKAMAAVARWVIEKEEEGLLSVPDSAAVLEEKRFHDVTMTFNRTERRVKIVAMRNRDKLDVEWEYVRGEMRW